MAAWRTVFVFASTPGLVLLVGLLASKEPMRHEVEVESHLGRSEIADTFRNFLIRERMLIMYLLAAIVLSQVGLAPIFGWLPAALIRVFGFSAGQAGQWLGLIFGAGLLSGVAIGTVLVSIFNRRGAAKAPLNVLGISLVLSAAAALAIPLASSSAMLALAVAAFIASVYVGMTVTPTLLIAVAPGHLRGRLIALETLVLLSAMAITPLSVGALVDHVFIGPHGLIGGMSAVMIPCSLMALAPMFGLHRLFDRSGRVASGMPGSLLLPDRSPGAG